MSSRTLNILLVVDDDRGAERLTSLLDSCKRPPLDVTRAYSVDRASLVAAREEFDVVLIASGLLPDLEHGVVQLPSVLLTVPVVVAVLDDASPWMERHPDGIADYLVVDRDPPHVVERLLGFAGRRHAMFRTLREAESQLRTIVEALSDGMLIVGERSEVLYANPAAESVLRQPLHAMIGAESPVPVPDDSPTEIVHAPEGGPARRLQLSSISVLWERRQAHLVSIRDITAERALEDNLRQARDEAERVAGIKTSFLANMSHELRMPLASMIGFAQLIQEGSDSEEHREFAQSIVESGNRLLETISSILDLTRLDADAVRAETRPVSVVAVGREVVGMLSALAARKGLQLTVTEAGGDDTVVTDPAVLRRILANLVGNAIKFTEAGSVRIEIDADETFVRTHVVDTGRGIEPEFLPVLFDEFSQESSGFSRSHEGSGLGLAITRRLCDLVGADIAVESTPGKGSTFTVIIPHESAWSH